MIYLAGFLVALFCLVAFCTWKVYGEKTKLGKSTVGGTLNEYLLAKRAYTVCASLTSILGIAAVVVILLLVLGS